MNSYRGWCVVNFKNVQAADKEWLQDWLEAQIENDEIEIEKIVIDEEEEIDRTYALCDIYHDEKRMR